MTKDYNIEVRVRNNYLMTKMLEKGVHTGRTLSDLTGVSQQTISRFLNLKQTPYDKRGEVIQSAERLCLFFGCEVEDLFPPDHLHKPLDRNVTQVEVSAQDARLLSTDESIKRLELSDSVAAILARARLTDKESEIVSMRLDGLTFEEIGSNCGVSKQRAAQLYSRALRVMRHPKVLEGVCITSLCDEFYT